MKKLAIILILFSLTTGLFADNEMLFQAVYLNSGRTYQSENDEFRTSIGSFGLSISSFVSGNGIVGAFGSMTVLIPLAASHSINGTESNLSIDDFDGVNFGLDTIFGPGVKLGKDRFTALIGGGFHINFMTLSSKSSDNINLSSENYGLSLTTKTSGVSLSTTSWGFGLTGTLQYNFTSFFNLNLSGSIAYDLLELRFPFLGSDIDFYGGTTYGFSGGIGIRY